MRDDLVPKPDWILALIEDIYAQGVRRPGYPANRWAIEFCAQRFREFGLENVRLEPVSLPYWEPRSWSLHVAGSAGETGFPCFPLPHSAPTEGIELELVPYDPASPDEVKGKASFHDVRLMRVPPTAPVSGDLETMPAADEMNLTIHPGGRIVDPRGTFEDKQQVFPFAPLMQEVMEPAIAAGAATYVGALTAYPGDSCEYYVPYDGVARPIPGVWIRGSDGARLRSLLDVGPVRIRLCVDSAQTVITDHNVVASSLAPTRTSS